MSLYLCCSLYLEYPPNPIPVFLCVNPQCSKGILVIKLER